MKPNQLFFKINLGRILILKKIILMKLIIYEKIILHFKLRFGKGNVSGDAVC